MATGEPGAPERDASRPFAVSDASELRRFIEDSPVAHAMFDREMRYLAASAGWRTTFGLADTPLEGRSHYDVFPDIPEHWKAIHRKCLAGAVERNDEESFVRDDGTVYWLRWQVRPWRTEAAGIGGIVIFSEDITERKQSHLAEVVREAERRLSLVLDAAGASVWTWDLETNNITFQEGASRPLGSGTPAVVSADFIRRHMPPDDWARLQEMADSVALPHGPTAWTLDYRLILDSGEVVWRQSRGRVTRDSEGRAPRVVSGISVDITERKRGEEALRRSERQLRLALDAASARAWTLDMRTDLVSYDPGTSLRFGLLPLEHSWPLTTLLTQIHADDRERVVSAIDQARTPEGQRGWAVDYRVTDAAGRTVWLRSVGSVEYDAAGVAVTAHGISLDVTSQKAAEAEAAKSHQALATQAAQLEKLTRQLRRLAVEVTRTEQRTRAYFAKVLHDHFQQLLFSALIRLDRMLATNTEPLLAQARAEVQEAIDAARSLSIELFPPVLRQGDLGAALKWLAGWMRQKYDLAVHLVVNADVRPSDDVQLVVFDSVRELLFNAKHARVQHVDVMLTVDDAGALSVLVADEGVGFEPERGEREWDGERLGLFGIRERITSVGGHLGVESAPGQGSRFTLRVPMAAPPHEEAATTLLDATSGSHLAAGAVRAGGPDRPVRIVLADDHALVREGLRELLSERNEFQVVAEAANGAEAVEHVTALVPDVVIMDVMMPVMNGLEATKRIKATAPQVRIFGLSTSETSQTLHPIQECGAEAYFGKGEGIEALLRALLALHASLTHDS